MAAIDDVLARLATDPAFRAALDTDPAAALRTYPLGPDDLARLEEALRAPAPAGDGSPLP